MHDLYRGLAAIGCTVFATSVAVAADMPTKAPTALPPPAVYNWTGFYVGLNAGGAWGQSDVVTQVNGVGTFFNVLNPPAINANGNSTVDPSGFTGGIQAGYNWQAGGWVFGIEADFNYFGLKDSRSVTAQYTFSAPVANYTINQQVETDWLFTLRPRLGWAFNNWLLYATGGLAVTEIKYTNTFVDGYYPSLQNGSVSKTQVGWTAGVGVEYAYMNSWSAKLEYLYTDFGNVSSNVPIVASTSTAITAPMSNSANLKANIVRVGLNKKF